jgi:hypothetical protein
LNPFLEEADGDDGDDGDEAAGPNPFSDLNQTTIVHSSEEEEEDGEEADVAVGEDGYDAEEGVHM